MRMRTQTSISSLITCISGSFGSYGLLGEYAKMEISFAWASGAINTASGALTDKDTAQNDFFSLDRCMGSLCCYRPTISRLRRGAGAGGGAGRGGAAAGGGTGAGRSAGGH